MSTSAALKVKVAIGAYLNIWYKGSLPRQLETHYFSFGEYLEEEETDSFGIDDQRIFFYLDNGLEEVNEAIEKSKKEGCINLSGEHSSDFAIISIESIVYADN